jgi:hypothetical protein
VQKYELVFRDIKEKGISMIKVLNYRRNEGNWILDSGYWLLDTQKIPNQKVH